MANRNCALYTRVSTLRQADTVDGSLDTQEARLNDYVNFENRKGKEVWEVARVYREEGRSAKNLQRPAFQRMMADIEAGKINTVIIWKIDRLSRSIVDFSMLWGQFQSMGIELISLNEKFDTSTSLGRAMLSIILVFAQLEREQTGERTSATMQYRAEQGLRNGGRVMGYDLDPENKGTFIVNEEQAQIVRRAFEICIEKGSAGQVQKYLNENGYRTLQYESRRGKIHGGKLFHKQAVVNMLTNPVYVGKMKWNDQIFDGKHEPILDDLVFAKVQEILGNNRKTRTNYASPRDHVYLLQGLLRCGKCGSMMTPKSGINGAGKTYHYYQCTRESHQGKRGCDCRYLPAKAIEDFIVLRVKELSVRDEEIEKIIAKANLEGDEKIRVLESEKKQISETLQVVREKLARIIDSLESGTLKAFDTVNERMETLEAEKKALEEKKTSLDFEVVQTDQERLSMEVMKQTFQSFRDILEQAKPRQMKELLQRIVQKVEWNEDETDRGSGHCNIFYFEQPHLLFPEKKPGDSPSTGKFARSMIWLPSTDSNRGHGG